MIDFASILPHPHQSDLTEENDLNIALMVPTLSVDEFYAEILQWFGVSNADMPYVLLNIENFYPIGSGPPIGFLNS